MQQLFLDYEGLEHLVESHLLTDDTTVTRSADGKIKLATAQTVWSGHQADWNALSPSEKAKYSIVIFDDDGEGIVIDDALSTTSENPVQNKVITTEINQIKGDLTVGSEINVAINGNTVISFNSSNTTCKLKANKTNVQLLFSINCSGASSNIWQKVGELPTGYKVFEGCGTVVNSDFNQHLNYIVRATGAADDGIYFATTNNSGIYNFSVTLLRTS